MAPYYESLIVIFQFVSPIRTKFNIIYCNDFGVCFFLAIGYPVARGCVLLSDGGESDLAARPSGYFHIFFLSVT